jgi:uncharacterized damage-inducible protein DinB
MSDATELANLIERSITGPMWHGSALTELLDAVTYQQAAARPIAGAHTIWELVLHITAWADIACDRLHKKSLGSQPNEVDWPPTPAPTEIAWTQARARLTASHQALAREAAKLTSEELAAMVPVDGPQYPVSTLLHGVVEHGTYHGGQIALLKRALAA